MFLGHVLVLKCGAIVVATGGCDVDADGEEVAAVDFILLGVTSLPEQRISCERSDVRLER